MNIEHDDDGTTDDGSRGEDSHLEAHYESQTELPDDHGWPGDGSGTDDLADYNANEADDYRNEGREDGAFEGSDE